MVRAIVVMTLLAALPLGDSVAYGALRRDVCQIATTDAGPARRALHRLRAARAGRNGLGAQSFPAQTPPTFVVASSSAAVLEATPPALSRVPRQETEVWPQASALFPAE